MLNAWLEFFCKIQQANYCIFSSSFSTSSIFVKLKCQRSIEVSAEIVISRIVLCSNAWKHMFMDTPGRFMSSEFNPFVIIISIVAAACLLLS